MLALNECETCEILIHCFTMSSTAFKLNTCRPTCVTKYKLIVQQG